MKKDKGLSLARESRFKLWWNWWNDTLWLLFCFLFFLQQWIAGQTEMPELSGETKTQIGRCCRRFVLLLAAWLALSLVSKHRNIYAREQNSKWNETTIFAIILSASTVFKCNWQNGSLHLTHRALCVIRYIEARKRASCHVKLNENWMNQYWLELNIHTINSC